MLVALRDEDRGVGVDVISNGGEALLSLSACVYFKGWSARWYSEDAGVDSGAGGLLVTGGENVETSEEDDSGEGGGIVQGGKEEGLVLSGRFRAFSYVSD